ncbi:DUF2272 domain-containing protein [Calidithermus timidus]|jgi:hypothetical protein|uniref:DUF2272 domain-containing protein n=1 Tax=Calidithermus timidus TaxID=307124 RepID=UPI00037E073F|nr:DUF2272 domain-containing protein [Calidithermus timidus]
MTAALERPVGLGPLRLPLWLLLALLAAVLYGGRQAVQRASGPSLGARAARAALEELERWRGLDEADPAARPLLERYWREGLGYSAEQAAAAVARRTHWSAAFVSYVMRRAGAGTHFRYSAAHVDYCAAAKRNRLRGDTANPFWLYRPREHAPQVGDLLCNARDGSGVTYDNVDDGRPRAAHCDVVVAKEPGRLWVVGGNVGDAVARRPVATDTQGRVSGAGYFAVLKVKHEGA